MDEWRDTWMNRNRWSKYNKMLLAESSLHSVYYKNSEFSVV